MNTRTAIGIVFLFALLLNLNGGSGALCVEDQLPSEESQAQPTAQQAAQWWLQKALKGVGALQEPLTRIYTFCEIGKEQARCDDRAGALKTFEKALDIVKNAKRGLYPLLGRTKGRTAAILADNSDNNTDTGKKTGPDQSFPYGLIAAAQGAAGLHEEALETAKKISDSNKRYVYGQIAAAEAEAGYIENANLTEVELKKYKGSASYPIAIAQALAGEYQQAVDTAVDEDFSPDVMYKIAIIALKAGHFDEAVQVAIKIKPGRHDSAQLMHHFDMKWMLVEFPKQRYVVSASVKAFTLAEIALAQAQAGKKEDAANTMAQAKKALPTTKDNRQFSCTLVFFARTESLLGNKKAAAEILDGLKARAPQSYENLCEVATGQVQCGMREQAKENFAAATKLAKKTPLRIERNTTYSSPIMARKHVIRAQARAGFFAEAIAAAKTMPQRRNQSGQITQDTASYLLCKIALEAAKAGQFELADELLPPNNTRRIAIGVLAARAGQFKWAKKFCKFGQKWPDNELYAYQQIGGLCEIGYIQIETGRMEQAREIFESMKPLAEPGRGYVSGIRRSLNQKMGRGRGLMGAEAELRNKPAWHLPYFCMGVAGGITERNKQAKEKAAKEE